MLIITFKIDIMKLKIQTSVFLLALFTSCEEFFIPEPGDDPEQIFEQLWATFEEEYAPFEERGVDWDSQYGIYRPMVTSSATEDELFDILSLMLSSLDDGHVSITAPGKEVYFSNRIRRQKIDDELFDLSIIKKDYLESGYSTGEEDSYVYGKLKNSNIAYIFFDYIGSNWSILDNFLSTYNNVNGYIIDLRHNQGGDFTFAFGQMGRFITEKKYVFRSKTKNGPGENDYTPWHLWHIEPQGNYVDKPLVVLTDRYTISAAERTVMAFRTVNNVTFIGDTTNGAHGTMIGRELANGWYYSLVTQKVEMFDGKSYEGVGLAPDITVINNIEDVNNGTDQVLETAIKKFTEFPE
jgi:carboxyl-terminal processing protease